MNVRLIEDEARRSTLKVGLCVRVNPGVTNVHDQEGVIVDGPCRDGDCLVLLAGWDHPIGFFWHELVISKSLQPGSRPPLPG